MPAACTACIPPIPSPPEITPTPVEFGAAAAAAVARDWRILWLAACWLIVAAVMFSIVFFMPLLVAAMWSGSDAFSGGVGGGGAHGGCSGEAGSGGPPSSPLKEPQGGSGRDSGIGGGGGGSSSLVALSTAIPFIVAAVGMQVNARLAERANERHRHAGCPVVLAGLALGMVPLALKALGPAPAFVLLSLAAGLVWSFHGESLPRGGQAAAAVSDQSGGPQPDSTPCWPAAFRGPTMRVTLAACLPA